MFKRLNSSSKALMVSDLINSIINIFAETFLVAYLLQLTDNNIVQVALYHIIMYSILGLGFLLIGKLVKKRPEKRVVIYRLGIIIRAIYILAIAILKENISNHYVLISIFTGISLILYWMPYNTMCTEIIENSNRKTYHTTKRILSEIVGIFVPIILGTSIQLTSFYHIATYVFILVIIQIIVSMKINAEKISKENQNEAYIPIKYFKQLTSECKKVLKGIHILSFLYGVILDAIRVVVIIIIIMTFKTSFDLGVLTTIFSLFSMIILYLFNKLYKIKYSKLLLLICSISIIIGLASLLLNIDKTTIIIYRFTYSITVCILELMFKIKQENIIKEYKLNRYLIEYNVTIEMIMNLGRVVGFCLMLIAGFLDNIIYFKAMLILLTLAVPVYSIILYKLENAIDYKEIEDDIKVNT